jgi:hypothetical protein
MTNTIDTKENTYKLIFANQSDTKMRYRAVRETKMYVFLQEIAREESTFIFRVHRKTNRVKGINTGADGYAFKMPTAIIFEKIDNLAN